MIFHCKDCGFRSASVKDYPYCNNCIMLSEIEKKNDTQIIEEFVQELGREYKRKLAAMIRKDGRKFIQQYKI